MYGIGSHKFVNNVPPPSGTVTGAQNATSLVGTKVELGLNPLLHATTFDLAGFEFNITQSTFNVLILNPVNERIYLGFGGGFGFQADFINHNYTMGDVSNTVNGNIFQAVDGSNQLLLRNKNGRRLLADSTNDVYQFGDIDNTSHHYFNQIDGASSRWSFHKAASLLLDYVDGQGLRTQAFGVHTTSQWLFGPKVAGAVVFDAANYIAIMVNGVEYKLALAN